MTLLAGAFLLAAPAVARLPAVDPQAIAELLPLAAEGFAIKRRADAREAAHREKLAKKGLAEVPPCGSQRYTVDTAGLLEGFSFNEWGEFYIDRRFVDDKEMETVRAIERWMRKWFPSKAKRRPRQAAAAPGKAGADVPVFRGFEDERYQKHDALIVRLVREFNADKPLASGGTPAQAKKIPDVTPALVKAHMIEESGGNGPASRAAWEKDPLQVNVPGDWGDEKSDLGLKKPSKRNEGTAEGNVRAAIRYLSRKGFSASGKRASARPKGTFDGWPEALRRYNGRRDRTATDRYYSDEYADKILKRAANPNLFVPIEIKIAKSGK